MEAKYIGIDYEEALFAKKQLLSAELGLLRTAKRLRNYKILRKKELATKTKLRATLRKLNTKINVFQSTLPEEEIPETPKRKEKKKKKQQEQNLQEQLQEIEEKLEKLQ